MEHALIYIILSLVFGFFMAWGIGANDVANAMGTSVGSKVFTLRQALLVAVVFEFLGSMLAGGAVTNTIAQGITQSSVLHIDPQIMVIGMLASLLSAGVWLLVATNYGWPVSTTHSIVGAIVGFTITSMGFQYINWINILHITLSWIISPILGAVLAFAIFSSVQKLILNAENPVQKALKYVPYYIFCVGFILSNITFIQGIKHLNIIKISPLVGMIASLIIGGGLAQIGITLLKNLKLNHSSELSLQYQDIEKIFGILMIFTACSMAFAHGSNDVANAVGPIAAILDIIQSNNLNHTITVNYKILLLGGLGIVCGLVTFGYKVIEMVGENITELTPSRGFAAEFAASTLVASASGLGLPLSTTHTLVGAILGIAMAKGMSAINLTAIRKIFMSWVITLPAGASLSIIFFYLLKYCMAVAF